METLQSMVPSPLFAHGQAPLASAAETWAVAEVVVPLPLPGRYTYLLPSDWAARVVPGMRLWVPFGSRKRQVGLVMERRILRRKEELKGLKLAEALLDDTPAVPPATLALMAWLADYYCCTEGEVLLAALPAGLRLQSETWVEPVPNLDPDRFEISDREWLVLDALDVHGALPIAEIAKLLDLQDATAPLRRMAEKGLIIWLENRPVGYRPRYEVCLRLARAYTTPDGLTTAFELVKRAPKQEKLLQALTLALHQGCQDPEQPHLLPRQRTLLDDLELKPHVARALIQKGIVEREYVQVDRQPGFWADRAPVEFNPAQVAALRAIDEALAQKPGRPVLLHGVTGSGKTEVYIALIRRVVARGQQALYLLPEIGLTPQIVERLRAAFGPQVVVYHSRLSPAERVEVWRKVLLGEARVVLGVRSAVLLPLGQLGCIVVDEEHDPSYKQSDTAPRFQARDVAVWLGHHLAVPLVLGSATPSAESYHHALRGKYALVELLEAAIAQRPPRIQLVDMRQQALHQLSQGMYSDVLLSAIKGALQRQEQVLLFRNRRGYSPSLRCNHCGYIAECHYCDIYLTYHKQTHRLRCHYCGYNEPAQSYCPACGKPELQQVGMGTERLEEHLAALLPHARIGRMDQDTTKGKYAFQELLGRFAAHELDILVGTQMVTKGLDFPRVTVVGVLDADQLLRQADFRAEELAYQLLAQFAGRAGRHDRPGTVYIQTWRPDHALFSLLSQPYRKFYEAEVLPRQSLGYPPFARLIRLEIQHRDDDACREAALRLGERLRPLFGDALLGPTPPSIARLKNRFRQHFLLKLPADRSPAPAKQYLREALAAFAKDYHDRQLRVILDVDPRD